MKQFSNVRLSRQSYDSCMNFTFMAPRIGLCLVTLWATGRYGFSLPKKVEIRTPEGEISTFLYFNRKLRLRAELSNRAIVKIAIARFLDGARGQAEPVEIEPDMRAYDGELTQVRTDAVRAPLRVRPGKHHARLRPTAPANAGACAAPEQG
jgi:hypothetical protein